VNGEACAPGAPRLPPPIAVWHTVARTLAPRCPDAHAGAHRTRIASPAVMAYREDVARSGSRIVRRCALACASLLVFAALAPACGANGDTPGRCDVSQVIESADYDQTCTTDSDCVRVGEGSVCYPCIFDCRSGAAINAASYRRYAADVARLVPGIGSAMCNCPVDFAPCCVAGRCADRLQCAPMTQSEGGLDAFPP